MLNLSASPHSVWTAAFGCQTKTNAWCLTQMTNSSQQTCSIYHSGLEYISLQQSDTKENKEICQRVMAEITILRFNEKWRHNLLFIEQVS